MASSPDTLSGLARILSSEPFPLKPMFRGMRPDRVPAEMEKWTQNLEIWLKKLVGKFTAENIITTIGQGGGGGLGLGFEKIIHKSYHFKGTDSILSVTMDDSYDWRRSLGFLARVSVSTTSVAALTSAPDFVYVSVSNNLGAFGGFPAFLMTYSDSTGTQSITVDSTGKLLASFGSGSHAEFWIDITVSALIGVSQNISDFVSIGNGL